MKTGRFLFIAFMTCVFLVAVSGLAAAANDTAASDIFIIDGLVVGVAEGDRLTVNSFGNEIRVRLYGVAAPQTAKIDNFSGLYKPGQPYADDAFRALSTKVLHQQVTVEIRKTLTLTEGGKQFALAIVYLDGRNINLEMISEGWGWAYRKFMDRVDYVHYSAAERLARAKKNGLWLQQDPQPPWCFKPQVLVRRKYH